MRCIWSRSSDALSENSAGKPMASQRVNEVLAGFRPEIKPIEVEGEHESQKRAPSSTKVVTSAVRRERAICTGLRWAHSHTQTRSDVILEEHIDDHFAKYDGDECAKALDMVFDIDCCVRKALSNSNLSQ